jgi:hypothetical protein
LVAAPPSLLGTSGMEGGLEMSDVTFPFMESDCSIDNDFLQKEFMTTANTILQLPKEIMEAFYDALERIRKNGWFSERIHRYHRLLFHYEDEKAKIDAIQELIDLEAASDAQASMLIPVILVSGLPHLIRFYRDNAIPREVLIETLSDLEIWMRHYKDQHGVWGTNNIKWLIRHFSGNIFRLGRLQFHFHPFPYKLNVFRHFHTGEVAAFTGDGVHFRRDGRVDGTNGIFNCAWISRFEMTDDHIIGHRISSDGCAQRETTRLSIKEWKPVLSEGDTILNVHIPEGSKMSHELCLASYAQAARFFTDYFPETDFAAFFCTSWLLSPQWRKLLPAESNIVKFQRDYHLFPILSDDFQTMERVFGKKPADLSTAPRDTQLQRVLLDYILAGNHIHNGAGFFLKEQIILKN